jgi:hypothetical protein
LILSGDGRSPSSCKGTLHWMTTGIGSGRGTCGKSSCLKSPFEKERREIELKEMFVAQLSSCSNRIEIGER